MGMNPYESMPFGGNPLQANYMSGYPQQQGFMQPQSQMYGYPQYPQQNMGGMYAGMQSQMPMSQVSYQQMGQRSMGMSPVVSSQGGSHITGYPQGGAQSPPAGFGQNSGFAGHESY